MSENNNDDDKTVIIPRGMQVTEPEAEDDRTRIISTPTTRPATGANFAAQDDSSGNPLRPGTYLGEFEIQKVLGEGGFGIVYLAWDHSLERRVALKEYMPAALSVRDGDSRITLRSERHRETFDAGMRSFINEAKLLAQFDHPSLVKVYRFWEDHGTAYMVMPFYEGPTLKQVLAEMPKPIDEKWLRSILIPLTEALEVLHRQQIYHRDVAPDNILILKDSGRPVILDFGAARRVIGDMTQALTVILKTGYAPVEQYAEVPDMRQGPWTDVYALGAVAHFALKGNTPPASVGRMINDTYKPLASTMAGQYSSHLLGTVDAALAVRPDGRLQDMGSFRAALLEGAAHGFPEAGASTSATGSSSAPQSKLVKAPSITTPSVKTEGKRSSLSPVALGSIAATVLLLVGGGLYGWLSSSAESPAVQNPPPPVAAAPLPPAPVVNTVPEPIIPSPQVFDILTEFSKAVAASTPGLTLETSTPQPRLKIDKDLLKFSLLSSIDGYAYVFLKTTDGKLMQLFPNNQTPEIRVKAGQRLSLPPRNGDLVAGGPPGTDNFLVMVSESKRNFKAADLKIKGGFGFVDTDSPVLLASIASRALPVMLGDTNCEPATCPQGIVATTFELEEVR